jgi:hypothetical protein
MSRLHHAPPPPPLPICIIWDSESESDNDSVHGLETDLVPSKNASIEGLFNKSKVRALTYLDVSVIIDTRLSDHIDIVSAFYYLYRIYALVVDKLLQMDNLYLQSNLEMEANGTLTKALSVEILSAEYRIKRQEVCAKVTEEKGWEAVQKELQEAD